MSASRCLDFSSSLYLGLRHSSSELGPWQTLTLGRPAAVCRWPDTAWLERQTARLCGAASSVIGRSTWHLFWDLVGLFGPGEWAILLDDQCYPIARWASGRHQLRGGRVAGFGHHDQRGLQHMVDRLEHLGMRPLIVTDSVCCVCGQKPDLNSYAATAAKAGGLVVIDDTQGVGLLGQSPSTNNRWGKGGGGSLLFHSLRDAPVVAVSSFAKALGVPLAVAAGPATLIQRMKSDGDTTVHCSQPSATDLASLRHALTVNRVEGGSRRSLLQKRIRWFREHARRLQLTTIESDHPSQGILVPGGISAQELVSALRKAGIVCLPGRGHLGGSHLVLLLNVHHTRSQIQSALDTIRKVIHAKQQTAIPGWRTRRTARLRQLDAV